MSDTSGFLAKGSLSSEEAERVASLDPRLSRTHYFDGRLLKATDLTRDQIYLDERSREIGRALGSGIVQGLELELTGDYRLIVSAGMALAPSGRMLELNGRKLEANLADYASISQYNQGTHRHLRRGLYAVVLHYTEIGTDAAEVYPRDLAEQRKFHFNSYSEGVVLTLVPLRIPLPSDNPLEARSSLVRELLPYAGQLPEIPDDGVALGLIAISNERPIWLDHHLLRRPLRHDNPEAILQQNLYRHYQELLAAVLSERRAAGLDGDFQASRHFRLLPPAGPLPKAAIEPGSGRQGFFPEHYRVHIAPVRRDDIPALLRESMVMPVLDLEAKGGAEIMVLAPLSDQQFAWLARRLEANPNRIKLSRESRLAGFDPLRLRLFPPTREIDTDTHTWNAIWSKIADEELIYVTRPPRAAETHISGVVLASGYEIPEKLPLPEQSPADTAALEQAKKHIRDQEIVINKLREMLKKGSSTEGEIKIILDKQLEEENKKFQEQRDKAAEAKAAWEEKFEKAKEELAKVSDAEEEIKKIKAELAAEKAKTAAIDKQLKETSIDIDELNKVRDTISSLKDASKDSSNNLKALMEEKLALEAEKKAREIALKEEQQKTKTFNDALARKESTIRELDARLKRSSGVDGAEELRKQLSIGRLYSSRRPKNNPEADEAASQLKERVGNNTEALKLIGDILMQVSRQYDAVIWPTLLQLYNNLNLKEFQQLIAKSQSSTVTAGKLVSESAEKFGINAELAEQWIKLG